MKLYKATVNVTAYFVVDSDEANIDLQEEARDIILDEIESHSLNPKNSEIEVREITALDQVSKIHHDALLWLPATMDDYDEEPTLIEYLEDQSRLERSCA